MAMLPNYKEIYELFKIGSTIEAQEKIMELRTAAVDFQEEVLALREQVKTLEAKLAERGKIEWEKPYYWRVEGETRDGPFCQVCYDKSSALIRLQDGKKGVWRCGVCTKVFYDKNYREPQVNRSAPQGDWRI